MYQIKKWAVAMMFLVFSTMALADWEYANNVDQQETGDVFIRNVYMKH